MSPDPSVHVVYQSMNRPLTIWGADRRLFLVALMMGAGVFNLLGSLSGGVVVFSALYAGARWLTISDPQFLRVVFNAGRFRAEYDPVTLEPCHPRRRP